MGDEIKQCIDRDRCYDKDRYDDCDCDNNDSGWGEWLPILLIVFLLCGGTNIFGGFGGLGGFGGGGCRDECCDNNGGFGSGWLLILILIFFLFQNNQGCGKDGGGFLGLF